MLVFIERIIAFVMAIITMILNLCGSSGGFLHRNSDDFRVVTYIVASTVQDEASLHSEDFDIITDVILFGCATFDRNGKVKIDENSLTTALNNIRKVVDGRDIKISLNFLGPGCPVATDDWYDMMAKQAEEHSHAFRSGILEDNIIEILDKYSFDGVSFDYEYPIELSAWHEYNKFLVSLDDKLGDRTLRIAVSDWDIKLSTAAMKAVDYFELMLYDVYEEGTGRHSTYEDSVKLSNNSALRGIPNRKVDFGLPFYSRPTDKEAYWYEYAPFCSQIDENGFFHDKNVDKTFWFNTPDVIEMKTDYAINNGFAGVMIWHYSCDLPSDCEMSLLAAIGRSIDSNSNKFPVC